MTARKSKLNPFGKSRRLIEADEFPFEFLSLLAEKESWRKEVHRPVHYLHKWWAKRLGSIFRGIILGSVLPDTHDLLEEFYKQQSFADVSVFDPFMGSGITVAEAHKLGCIALGRDINPVAAESVRVALGPIDLSTVEKAFDHLSNTVGSRIRELYQCVDKDGGRSQVLYYFWVKQANCPACDYKVDLFSSFVIARNAYPNRKPEVQICCPRCGDIFPALNTDKRVCCHSCQFDFDPHMGPVRGSTAQCANCLEVFPILGAIRAKRSAPDHRLYCKLILSADGDKRYVAAGPQDVEDYRRAADLLKQEAEHGSIQLPITTLADGFNTRQAIGYNYTKWRDFFNDRQLLALGWLQEAIAAIADPPTRDVFLLLFSGVLEFNNLFASYKGEGTGAVRHMFAHHILKPERTPIEANVWGTPKSSGSFSTLFKTRLLRAVAYRTTPTEVQADSDGGKISSPPFSLALPNIA